MTPSLKDKIQSRQSGILTYGLTPPKLDNTEEKIAEIAQKQLDRVRGMDIDALVVYDIQEEADRTNVERPFPYLPTLDASYYCEKYFGKLSLPKIIYRCVGKYDADQLKQWVNQNPENDKFSVFVGASSTKQAVRLSLADAYTVSKGINPSFLLGGVAIPERHISKLDEHLRVVRKMESGCAFFISQAVYNVEAAKSFLSDYYYYCQDHAIAPVPIIFTITPCGSLKTLDFMGWLGISIPRWLENELKHSADILDKSVTLSLKTFEELWQYASEKNIPVGCNVESVSVRKVEIDASMALVEAIKHMMRR